MTETDKNQVKIRFFTREKDESLQVQDTPIYVPIQLKRYGLSEIVNHLLSSNDNAEQEKEKEERRPVPFDFLIDGELLRSSLDDYLVKHGLSTEVSLDVEYTRAVLPPSFLASFSNEDWISSIDVLGKLSNEPLRSIVTGSYDGVVRTWGLDGTVKQQYSGHTAAIRAVKCITDTRLVSAGNDRSLRLWKIKGNDGVNIENDNDNETDIEEGKTLAILVGHKAPVVSLDVSLKTSRILSGSYDNTIGLWSTNYKEMTAVDPLQALNGDDQADGDTKLSSAARKRRRLELKDRSIRRRAPLSLLESHTAPVEQAIFDLNDNTLGYSVSQDHTIKTWDLVTSRCVDTKTTSYSLLSVAHMKTLNLLACGSSARHIILHDPRSDSNVVTISQRQLVGHKNFVVSLDTSPDNEYMLCSGSHDGTVKVWDIRTNVPLFTITRENAADRKAKVFAVRWDDSIGIISGGEDKKLQINKGDNIYKKEV